MQDPRVAALEDSIDKLTTSLRRVRTWLVVLYVVLGLGVLGTVCPIAFVAAVAAQDTSNQITPAQVQSVKTAVEKAYPNGVDLVSVRKIQVAYSNTPFPFTFLDSGTDMIYVEYRTSNPSVTFAGAFDPTMSGTTLSESGLTPTASTGENRMTAEQLARFLTAYAAKTGEPLGGVLRYSDESAMTDSGSTQTTVTISGTDYRSSELWQALPGKIVTGGKTTRSDDVVVSPEALIFHLDPKTGDFTYVGSEAYSGSFDPGLLD